MSPAILLGLFYHWVGGLASASFYIPYRGVRRWSWETYWLAGGVFSWLIAPWAFGLILVPGLLPILAQAPASTLLWSFFFGMLWGIGGLTFGLTMRYLGIALGMAVALGFCAAFGTLMPPLFTGEIGAVLSTRSGHWILGGVFLCLLGIGFSGLSGMSKEKELPQEQKQASVREFNFTKGIFLALFAGIMSASMSYGFEAARPLSVITAEALEQSGRSDVWQNLPALVVILAGGFCTNFVWCLALHFKNNSGREYLGTVPATDAASGAVEPAATGNAARTDRPLGVPLLRNYILCAAAGLCWYLQFFFYSIGETKMGAFKFSSWTLHMASIIIFSTLWGIVLHEWKGTSRRTHVLIAIGLLLLVLSTVVIGYGNAASGEVISTH